MVISKMITACLAMACSICGLPREDGGEVECTGMEIDEVHWSMSEPLLQLLGALEVPHDGTAASIISGTQKYWIRPAGKERWEIEGDLTDEQKAEVFPLAAQLGFIHEMPPSEKHYDYCLLFGATVGRMEKRMGYAVKLWDEGVRFKEVVFLTGARPLDPAVDKFLDVCKTETQAAHYMWDHADLPKELRALPITFVDVDMISTGNAKRRPTTADTVAAWMSLNPKPGNCLGISNQPLCRYQGAVVKSYLPKDFQYETAGEGVDTKHLKGLVLLDSIARWLYQLDR